MLALGNILDDGALLEVEWRRALIVAPLSVPPDVEDASPHLDVFPVPMLLVHNHTSTRIALAGGTTDTTRTVVGWCCSMQPFRGECLRWTAPLHFCGVALARASLQYSLEHTTKSEYSLLSGIRLPRNYLFQS